jgi:hypothetical protein
MRSLRLPVLSISNLGSIFIFLEDIGIFNSYGFNISMARFSTFRFFRRDRFPGAAAAVLNQSQPQRQ